MFGNLNKPSFGAAAPSTSFGFGQNANTANPFGQTQGLFSKPSTAFGTTTSTFGQAPTTSLFGAASQPQQSGLFGQTNTSTFGAAPTTQSGFGTSLFGQQPTGTGLFNSSSTFGQQPKPTFGSFGAAQPAQPSTGLFGSPQQPAQQQTTGLFGQTPSSTSLFGSTPGFGATQQNGTTIKFNPVTGTDTMMKSGTSQSINTKHHSITCMKEYESKSFEELRMEDYMANRKGPQQTAGFGGSTFGAQTAATPSLFGQPADASKPAFGQATPAFGQTATPFGQSTSFGMGAQQSTAASPFGAKPTTFGSPATSSFGFGTSAQQSTGLFGSNAAQKPFGTATTQSLFNTSTTQQNTFGGGMGLTSNTNTTGLFGKPTQATPLFGAPTQQNTGFSFNTPASTQSSLFTPASKPLFGTTTTTPAFGASTGAFGTNTGFSSTFGKTSMAPAFGTATPSFGSTFGGTTNQNTSIFGNQNQPKPGGLFGSTGGTGLFSSNTSTPGFQSNMGFGLGQPHQQTSLLGTTQDPNQQNNLALMTHDPFGDAPHLAGLEPKLASNTNSVSATDPKELKALLDASKKVDMSHSSKLKVVPARSIRDTLFDSIPKSNDGSKSPLTEYHKTSCRRLILKRQPASDVSHNVAGSNILDVLNSEDKENAIKEQANKQNSSIESKINPMRLNFTNISHNETSMNRSLENQTYNVSLDDVTKENSNESARHEVTLPPSDDEEGEETGGESPSKKYPCGVVCSRPEYYTLPGLEELTPDENGRCFVKGFTIGRKGYGNVYFPEEIDVSGLNLDELVHFRYREISIYPDDTKKPPVGQELNRKAQVTLDNVYPTRNGTNNLIKDLGELMRLNFAEKLRKVSDRINARFVDYRPETGSWVFKVEHFSRYGYSDSEDETDQDSEVKKAQKPQDGAEIEKIKASEMATKKNEIFMKQNKHSKSMQRASREDRSMVSTGFGLDKDIIIDDVYEQDDVLHQSVLVDDMSDAPEYHQIPTDIPVDYHDFGSMKNSRNIQVMKSTLFADDDRSSDGAASQVSILKQYLDLPEDMEEIPRLPVVSEEVAAKRRTVIRPKVYSVLNSFDTPGCDSEVLPNRCCADLSMFKGKSFKVGWSRGFNFWVFGDPERETNSELSLKTFDKSPSFDALNDVLLDSLKIVLQQSTHELSSVNVPTFKIQKTESYLSKQMSLFEKVATQYNSKQANYLFDIWTLCNALWGLGENSVAERRRSLTQWLKETTSADDNSPLRTGPFESNDEAVKSIFAHLTTFKIFEAANIAMNNKMPNLALLIAQLSVPNLTKALMQEQMENWYNSMASNHISDEMKKLYLLLAGIPTKENINIFEDLDWKRSFAMHLWYICPNGAPIELAIELYKKSFEEYSYAVRPNPSYLEGQFLEDGPFDVMYHILTLYKSGIHRLSSVLNPATITDDPLDYRLSWLLLQLFRSLDVGLIESAELNKICTSFSNQLEQLGHWEWAIFVLLYLEDDSVKKILITSILGRNLSQECDPETLETIDILVNEMHVPTEWIHQVKGYKTLNAQRYLESFNHFSLAGDSIPANHVFIEHLLPTLFINEQFEVLKKLMEKISPFQSTNPAYVFHEYLTLQEQSLSSKSDSVIKLQMKLDGIGERISSFPIETDQQKLCVAELSKRCATLYRELCKKSSSGRFQEFYVQFVEALIMPPDFKQNEGLFLINEVCDEQFV